MAGKNFPQQAALTQDFRRGSSLRLAVFAFIREGRERDSRRGDLEGDLEQMLSEKGEDGTEKKRSERILGGFKYCT